MSDAIEKVKDDVYDAPLWNCQYFVTYLLKIMELWFCLAAYSSMYVSYVSFFIESENLPANHIDLWRSWKYDLIQH
jgi:hypothetical protein